MPDTVSDRIPAGVCIGTFESPTDTYNEPYVAVHPTDPDVVAIGMNVLRTPPVFQHGNQAHVCLVDDQIAFTEDGGDTWRISTLPPMPGFLSTPQGLCLVGEDHRREGACWVDPRIDLIRGCERGTPDVQGINHGTPAAGVR